jgi:hypothetical protein
VGRSSRCSQCNNVDFPESDGLITGVQVPEAIPTDTSSSAGDELALRTVGTVQMLKLDRALGEQAAHRQWVLASGCVGDGHRALPPMATSIPEKLSDLVARPTIDLLAA